MAFITSAEGRVKPGRYNDFVAQANEASKLYQRLGAAPPRLFVAGVAGESFGTWTFSVECDSAEQYGDLTDRGLLDGEMQAFKLRQQEENNPTTLDRVTLAAEIPLRDGKDGRGNVLVVHVARTNPGGLERGLELASRVGAFVERLGAVRTRTFDLIGAGQGADLTMSTWEFESMTAFARAIEGFSTDPDGQAIALESVGIDAPITRVFEGVYTEIPL
jgi:hypothetical protein